MPRQETRDSLSRNLRMLQRHVSKTEREMQQINQTLIEQNERKRVDLLAAQERIAELEAENSALRLRLSDRPALRDRLDELLKLETLTDEQRAENDRLVMMIPVADWLATVRTAQDDPQLDPQAAQRP